MIKRFSSAENPHREEILRLMEKNNEETTPSIQEMTNRWIADKELGLEEAVQKFYEERIDEVLVCHEEGLMKGFFMLEKNDEGIKEHVPQHWPHIEISLGIVREEYRGQGIAEKLLTETEKHVKEKDIENMVRVTSTANKASKKFVENNSLEKIAEFNEDREDEEKTVIFAKKV
jgi:ribosomal protein S18 acetylase RimI-like enzyme